MTPDGTTVELVTLTDGRCALLRDGQPLRTIDGDAESVDRAVREFLQMTREARV